MCAGAGGRGLVSALDWACLEQQSRRRITTVTVIRMATAATMVVTGTPMAATATQLTAVTDTHMPTAVTGTLMATVTMVATPPPMPGTTPCPSAVARS